VHTPIDGHGPSDGGFTGQVRVMLLGQQAMDAKAPCARVRLLQVQDLFEKRQRQLRLEMGRGLGPLVLQSCKPVVFKGCNDRIHVGTGHL
jgi:hypothetical protein